jgi:hypothetical protein
VPSQVEQGSTPAKGSRPCGHAKRTVITAPSGSIRFSASGRLVEAPLLRAQSRLDGNVGIAARMIQINAWGQR